MKKITVIPHISTLLALILPLSFLIPDAITVHAADNLFELQKAYDDALAQYNKGSAGFFESLMDSDPDAKEAYEIMMDMDGTHQYRTTENIRPYTDPADNMDAAFLDNMKMAIDFISTANALRENDTTLGSAPALYVTHTLMAISQLCCNRSSSEPIHCKAYNIGENLAWGYTRGRKTPQLAAGMKGRAFFTKIFYLFGVNTFIFFFYNFVLNIFCETCIIII